MAAVTNVMLTTRFTDRDNVKKLDELVTFRADVGLVSCDDPEEHTTRWYGGDARLGMNVCVGAIANLDLAELVLGMRRVRWAEPDFVQLFVCAEDDMRFVEVDWQRTTERPEEDRIEG